MRIDATNLAPEPPEKSTTGPAAEASNSASAGTSATPDRTSANIYGSDQASFSYDQTRVQTLKAQVLAQSDVRDSKVKPLQQAIENGEYSVPASHVAEALASELSA
jgi:flagellar biosynthesis anti-sigma factor FlgM